MSTTTNERSIGELLTLTYSEMTPEEIERVVEYKSERKFIDKMHSEEIRREREIQDAMLERQRERYEAIASMLESMYTVDAFGNKVASNG